MVKVKVSESVSEWVSESVSQWQGLPIELFWTAKKDLRSSWICLTFLQCVFSNVFVNCIAEMMYSDTGCICLTFLHYAFSNVSSKCLIGCIFTLDICWICLPSAFSNVFLNSFSKGMQNQVGQIYICLISQLLPRQPTDIYDFRNWDKLNLVQTFTNLS